MGKLDKKVLKVISTQEDLDFDVDDISIALKCDDDEVQEALDSLKDQGLIEAVIHNGKKYWKPARSESIPKVDQTDPPSRDDSSFDVLILEQPAHSFKPQEQQHRPQQRSPEPQQRQFNTIDQVARQPQRTQEQWIKPPVSPQRPAPRSYENEIVDDNTKSYIPPMRPAKLKAAPIKDTYDGDDEDFDDDFKKPRRTGSSIGSIAIAVFLSAGISALITMALTGNSTKGLGVNIAALEGKVMEADGKLNQRIDALSLKMDNIKTDIAATAKPTVAAPVQEAQVKTLPTKSVSKRAMKAAVRSAGVRKAAAKRSVVQAAKKKKTAAEMIQETSESSDASQSSSSSSSTGSEAASSAEPAASTSSSPSAAETPAATSESSSPSASDPSSSASSGSGGIWEGNASPSTDGSTSGQ
jgi:hypothetical protein